MISAIGKQRFTILCLFAITAILLAASSYLYLTPQSLSLKNEVNKVKGQVGTVRTEMDVLRSEYSNIETQVKLYNNLRAIDFFKPQDRVDARKRLEAIQRFTSVLGINYQLLPGKIETNKALEKAGQVVLLTPIQVRVNAMDDMDLYGFLYMMLNSFPGHVALSRLDFSRVTDINETTLRAIGSGQNIDIMVGNMEFFWRTIIPASMVPEAGLEGTGM